MHAISGIASRNHLGLLIDHDDSKVYHIRCQDESGLDLQPERIPVKHISTIRKGNKQ